MRNSCTDPYLFFPFSKVGFICLPTNITIDIIKCKNYRIEPSGNGRNCGKVRYDGQGGSLPQHGLGGQLWHSWDGGALWHSR